MLNPNQVIIDNKNGYLLVDEREFMVSVTRKIIEIETNRTLFQISNFDSDDWQYIGTAYFNGLMEGIKNRPK